MSNDSIALLALHGAVLQDIQPSSLDFGAVARPWRLGPSLRSINELTKDPSDFSSYKKAPPLTRVLEQLHPCDCSSYRSRNRTTFFFGLRFCWLGLSQPLSLFLLDQTVTLGYKAAESQCTLTIRLTRSAKTAYNKAKTFWQPTVNSFLSFQCS